MVAMTCINRKQLINKDTQVHYYITLSFMFTTRHQHFRFTNREQYAITVSIREEDQTRVSMDDLTRVLLGSILRLLHQEMESNHNVVRAYPRQRRHVNRRVQRSLRAVAAAHNTPATVLTQGPA
jgi:hypothetical protein